MGLFKSKKKQTEKDLEREQWEHVNSPEAKAALQQEKAQAAAAFAEERTIICGDAMFSNMTVKSFISGAENVELYLMPDPDSLIAKCREFRPTILVLTADAEKYPELPERLARECPDAALILSSPKPEAFHSAYARAVLRKPFHKEDFLAAIQDIKNSK